MAILTHFSEHPINFNRKVRYSNRKESLHKPDGMWFSDESGDYAWSHFCIQADWMVRLKYRMDIKLDLSRIACLDTDKKTLAFTQKYQVPIYPIEMNVYSNRINWKSVKKDYAGFFVSPYSTKFRYAGGYSWYYGLDCACACVWDLRAVEVLTG
jgi:hypothetical protein